MLGLGTGVIKSGIKGIENFGIVTDNLVLNHSNYHAGPVQPISSGAASFNGTSDYIAINAKPVDTADATYCWWSNSTQTNNGQPIFSHGGNNIGSFQANVASNQKPLLYLNSNLYQYWVDTGFADDGKWHHWALVLDIDDMTACKLYIDGVEIAQDARTTSDAANSYGNMEIGRYNTSNEFDGYICNFGVWSSHLSQAQIKSIMNKNYSGLDASEKTNLVSWWNLDKAYDSSVFDSHHAGGDTLGPERAPEPTFTLSYDPIAESGSLSPGGWSINTNWVIANGVATCLGTSGSSINKGTIADATTGLWYRVSVDIITVTGTGFFFRLGTGHSTPGPYYKVFNTVGTHVFYLQSNSALANYRSFYINPASSSNTGSIDNVSVKLVNGNTGTLS